MDIKNEVLIRVYGVLFLIVLIALVIFFKAFKISQIEGDKWRGMGKDLYVTFKKVAAERGNIMAEDGSLLATSLPFFEIRFDPNSTGMSDKDFNDNIDSLAHCIATWVDTSYTVGGYRDFLVSKRQEGARNVRIRRRVSYPELKMIEKFPLFNLGQYKGGLIVQQNPKRERPFKLLAHRSIGYIREGAKPVGLEGYYNDILEGQAGQKLMKRVGKDTWIPINDLTEIEPKNGHDIITTIDINLQEITEMALYRAVNHHRANHGTAILMDVKTGAIKAIANIGRTPDEKLWETFNYAIGESVEPGSTYKLASIMSLLEDGYIHLDDSIDLEKGSSIFYEEVMLDASYHLLDTTTIRKAFEISSNVGIAKLVQKHYEDKAEKFIGRLKKMNLHLPVGIEIEGEAPPYIKEAYNKKEDWSGITLPWMSIGYEVMITPLQLLTFYNAVANDGQMMKPYLVSEIQHFGETVEKFKPIVTKKKIASKSTIVAAQSLLEGVVERGTAHKWKSPRFRFAGKTGTAQIDYPKFIRQQSKNLKYRASFAGYFPADDPVYSCIVMITDPKEHGIYGGDVALPVFREIADKCFDSEIALHKPLNSYEKPRLSERKLPVFQAGNTQDIQKVLSKLNVEYENQTNSEWAITKNQSDTLLIERRTLPDDQVPNVTGMGLRDALYILENRGLHVKVQGAGRVARQSLIPGTRIKGQTIRLTLQ